MSAQLPSAYLALQHAQSLFQTTPDKLDDAQHAELNRVVQRQVALERAILASPEAAGVTVTPNRLHTALEEIQSRYASDLDFANDLACVGLTRATLREELHRSLRVELVLEKVVRNAPPISTTEAEIFYLLHMPRFVREERRKLRHILMTINPELKGSDEFSVRERMRALHAECVASPDRFADLAHRHSECPTALQGGSLGAVPRNKLFPSLEAEAFGLGEGALSSIVESPLGLHILLCEQIEPATTLPFSTVHERIRNLMLETRLRNRQRAWIHSLRAGASDEMVRLRA